MQKSILVSAVILIVTGVILGAFAAHALKQLLLPEQLESMNTGIDYQLYHGLAVLVLWVLQKQTGVSFKTPMALMVGGVLMFSVSIYLLACQDVMSTNFSGIWMVTPIGGGLLITAWILVGIILFKWKGNEDV